MATTYKAASQLLQETAQDLTSPKAWLSLLKTIGANYKYTFEHQIMIFAQKPEATACASYDIWNDKLHRWIQKGAKGIALIDDSGSKPKLQYVFDISDTFSNSAPSPVIWQLNEQHHAQVIEDLDNAFGGGGEIPDIDYHIALAVQNIVDDNIQDYFADALANQDGAAWFAQDNETAGKQFRELLMTSVTYAVCARCKLDTFAHFDETVFSGIESFNTLNALTQLGSAVSDLTGMALRQIERSVKAYDEQEKSEQRSEIYEQPYLHAEGRLPDSRPDTGRDAHGADRQIWPDAQDVSERTPARDVLLDAPAGDAAAAPDRHESSSPSADAAAGTKPAGAEPASQDGQHAGIDSTPQRDTRPSGRNRDRGADTQLTLFQTEPIPPAAEAEEKESSAFLVPETAPEPVVPKETVENSSTLSNFHITDERLGEGTTNEKLVANLNAIQTLKALDAADRSATPEEMDTLSRYVGWGGLPQVFDEQNNVTMFATARSELKRLLSTQEYESARASTLNAHYTTPVVINAIYNALSNLGFEGGSILEPACGIGNFFGLVPENMQNSKLIGVELDSITGRIAQKLYPNADIHVTGFQDTLIPDNSIDVAIGNVPFGGYKVPDRQYDKYNFHIHDYFFAKTLDKVRAGGIIAFVTSKGTLDKQSPDVRKYIAQHAELLGAVRLPNTAFKRNAGTEVTTDIIFLQKREYPMDVEPDWVHLGLTNDGIPINSYYVDNPHMLLGRMVWDKSMYGNEKETALLPHENQDLAQQLREAISNITGSIQTLDIDALLDEHDEIPAVADVPKYSFATVDGRLYYREDAFMHPHITNKTAHNRILGLIELRETARALVQSQLQDDSDAAVSALQSKLDGQYNGYVKAYGRINSRANELAFSDDSAYPLLCSLEVLDDKGEFERKADIFSKRTIRAYQPVTEVDTPQEALWVSLRERACVDIGYMASLCGKSADEVIEALSGQIFKNPINPSQDEYTGWETADEYLSGNVREKLRVAEAAAQDNPQFMVNVTALQAVQPVPLDAADISVRLGATWIPDSDVTRFVQETFNVSSAKAIYADSLGRWNITNKFANSNIFTNETFGTKRVNALQLIEESLNLRDVKIFDTKYENGKEIRVFNRKETLLARQKQDAIRRAFKDWIFKDPERRNRLVDYYNEHFNSMRVRKFSGEHLTFAGMNPEIRLQAHQKDAVARILYGENALLHHVVGAGKTFSMATAAMELRRVGLAHKPMFVVPNHLTGQWAAEFTRLYPSANLLVAYKRDFETSRRKKFCARIATGNYDAVIMGHSQFEKIPVSLERQQHQVHEQIDEITFGIEQAKAAKNERYTIKQMEYLKKSLEARLEQLQAQHKKDNVLTFEELGVDRLFVDESHAFKNLFIFTKMRGIAGISTAESQRASDMFLKCRYMDEITGGRGITFATGTPISNSMSEMFTIQRYLQYDLLKDNGLLHFDSWATMFGETTSVIELAPEGTGYRQRMRFARFYNLPELLQMYRQFADVKTGDMLKLPIPALKDGKITVVSLEPSELQREMVQVLADRAEKIRGGGIDPHLDNMLSVTNDGRKLALDQRLLNPLLPDYEHSKANACVDNVFRIWQGGQTVKHTQLVFCDMSTPKPDVFNVYDDIRAKLQQKGVPESEIAYIHDAKTDVQKAELFNKVRSGEVRVLIGSTQKMGAGTNVRATRS